MGCSGSEPVRNRFSDFYSLRPQAQKQEKQKTILLAVRSVWSVLRAMVRKGKSNEKEDISAAPRCSARLSKRRADTEFSALAKMVSSEEEGDAEARKQKETEKDEKEEEAKEAGEAEDIPLAQTQMYSEGDRETTNDSSQLTQVETTNASQVAATAPTQLNTQPEPVSQPVSQPGTQPTDKSRRTPLQTFNPNPREVILGKQKLPVEENFKKANAQAQASSTAATTVVTTITPTASRTPTPPVKSSKKKKQVKKKE